MGREAEQPDAQQRDFDRYDHVVRGSITVDGVNYAKYEQVRERDEGARARFLDAVKDDFISEVGSIKAVVLHYDAPASDARHGGPSLVDAEWSINTHRGAVCVKKLLRCVAEVGFAAAD
eukprot:gene53204-16229_t